MAWITLTETDVLEQLTGDELKAAREEALAQGQGDPLPGTLSKVARQVRSYVAGCHRNRLAAGDAIPDECKRSAVSLVVHDLAVRFPGAVILKTQRETAKKDALDYLQAVAACEVALAQPAAGEVTDEVIGGGACQLVRHREPIVTMKGLQNL